LADGRHEVIAMTRPSGPEWAIEAMAQIDSPEAA
jgi:hypothetical protein